MIVGEKKNQERDFKAKKKSTKKKRWNKKKKMLNVGRSEKKTREKWRKKITETNDFFENEMKKEEITREELGHEENKQEEIKQEEIKQDEKQKNRFFELFFTFVSFDQNSFPMKKSSLFPDLLLGCLFLKNNVLESFLLKKKPLTIIRFFFSKKKVSQTSFSEKLFWCEKSWKSFWISSLSTFFLEKAFSISLKNLLFFLSLFRFFSFFLFIFGLFFLRLPFFKKKKTEKWEAAWCNGCPAGEKNDNWTYIDFTRSTSSPHAAVTKRALNRASNLRRMWKKVSWKYKKCFSDSLRKKNCSKSFCFWETIFYFCWTKAFAKETFLFEKNGQKKQEKNKDNSQKKKKPIVFSPYVFSLYVYSPSSTRGKKLLERLGDLRRWGWTLRIRWSASKINGRSCWKNKNLSKDNSITCKRKQADWKIVAAALVIREEHMSDYHTRLKLILHMAWAKNQSNDTKKKNLPNHCARGCTLAMSWSGNRFTERRWRVDWKEMMKCGIDGRARMEKRTRKEAKWKQRTRRDRSLRSRVVQFSNGAAQSGARKLSWSHRFSTLPCVTPRQVHRI